MQAFRAEETEKKEQKKKKEVEKVGMIASFEQSLMDDNDATPRPSSKRPRSRTIRRTSSQLRITLVDDDNQSDDEAQIGVGKKVKLTDAATDDLEESDNFEPGETGESETNSMTRTVLDVSETEPEAPPKKKKPTKKKLVVREAVKAINKSAAVPNQENAITEKLPHGDSRDASTINTKINHNG
jgi:hypothetical protein